ncbi:MAG TPA: type 1 glutamine amidotransferase domain-containing protein [bacterium]
MAVKTKKIALLVGKDFEDMEVMYPLYRLREAGYQVDIIGEDVAGTKYFGKNGYPVVSTLEISKAKSKDYAGLVAPGGWAPDKLRRNPKILKLVSDVDHQGGVIASICHGPWILISAGIMKGKKTTSTPALKDDLLNAGAKWVDEEVTVDGRLVTSRKPDDLPAFMREMLKLMEKN